MPFSVPNLEASPPYDAQAVCDSTDIAALELGLAGTGWLTGLALTWTSGFTFAYTAGTAVSGGTTGVSAGSGSVTPGAASPTDRRDAVVVSSSGTVSVIAGTPCAVAGWTRNSLPTLPPVKPAIPAGSTLLWEIAVPGGASALSANSQWDKRVYPSLPAVALQAGSGIGLSGTGPIVISEGAFTPNIVSAAGATQTLQAYTLNDLTATPSTNCTLTPPAGAQGVWFDLNFWQAASGSAAVATWWATVDWGVNGAPSQSTAANAGDSYHFEYSTKKSQYMGFVCGQGY